MALTEYLSRNLFAPLYNELHGKSDIFAESQVWRGIFAKPLDVIDQLSRQRLKNVLRTAYEQTSHYRRIFDESKFDFNSDPYEQLARLPILDKDDIRRDPDGFLNRSIGKPNLVKTKTGGSTSDPLVFYRDKDAYCTRWGLQAVANERLGWQVGEWYALVWGAVQDLDEYSTTRSRLVNKLVHRRIQLDAGRLTREKAQHFVTQLHRYRPRIIYGYPVMIEALIDMAADWELEIPTAELVVVTAETLTQRARVRIARHFQCPVVDRYASREFGIIADQVPDAKALRLAPASVCVEIKPLSDSDPTFGELIITDLLNVGMPFIRYRTGDIGRFERRTINGQTWDYLSDIAGRTTDLIYSPTGRIISGTAALPLFGEEPGVDQAQIHQFDYDKFKILVVKGKYFTDNTVTNMRETMYDYCGAPVEIDFEFVETIPRDPSGKFRVVVSHLTKQERTPQIT